MKSLIPRIKRLTLTVRIINQIKGSANEKNDLKYWVGGNEEAKDQADIELYNCVAGSGEETIANIMYTGVQIGGSPYFNTSFRWGYGWSFGRGFEDLTLEEKKQVKLLTPKNITEVPISDIYSE